MSDAADGPATGWSAAPHASIGLGERLAVSLARARRWEFWPGWLFYIPVVGYIVWRGARASNATVFTAANPAMEAGGVVGERKAPILDPILRNDPELVAEFELLRVTEPVAARIERVVAFAMRCGWPLVLKPDIGQRGRGVQIVRSREEAAAYLGNAPGDALVQRYVEGAEFGLFVYRDPVSGSAEVLSVTSKNFPSVTGDGASSLAALIRADARARLISPFLWQRWAARLDWVPAAGERVQLVEIGAHCRGSLFLDASDLASDALRAWVERLFRAAPGYHFGRLDVRCPSAEALSRGEGIRILEVNGVTAEAAHIYHPDTPLIDGWRSMFRQWGIAFDIGEANARAGAAVTDKFELLRLWREDMKRGEGWF